MSLRIKPCSWTSTKLKELHLWIHNTVFTLQRLNNKLFKTVHTYAYYVLQIDTIWRCWQKKTWLTWMSCIIGDALKGPSPFTNVINDDVHTNSLFIHYNIIACAFNLWVMTRAVTGLFVRHPTDQGKLWSQNASEASEALLLMEINRALSSNRIPIVCLVCRHLKMFYWPLLD